MKIELLYLGDCPNYVPARAVLQEALRLEQVAADVAEMEIKDEAMARAIGFIGSPSIRINGADVDPEVPFLCRFHLLVIQSNN